MTLPSDANSKVAIVIVTHNALQFVSICLESVRRYSTMPHEIIVVDNCSEPAVRQYLQQFGGLKLVLNESNSLWCQGNNQGIEQISDEVTHILLLNSDMEVRRADWLQRMVNVADSAERIGIVGTAAHRVRIWPTFGGVDGQCLMFKRHLIEEIGPLDSERLPWNGADIDLAAKAFKKGYIYKIMPKKPELVVHYHGMSRRQQAAPSAERLQHDIDIGQIIKDAGLCAWKMPRFVWEIYKRLPGKPFFELTHAERKLARGSRAALRKHYGQKFT